MPGWSQEQDEILRTMAAEGYSASIIGQRLNRSRNAVIGRVGRLPDVALRRKQAGDPGARKRVVPRKPKKRTDGRRANGTYKPKLMPERSVSSRIWATGLEPGVPKPPKPVVEDGLDIGTKTLVQLKSTECHWPCGDPKQPGFLYCGAPGVPIEREPAYCERHLRRACPNHADLRNT
jgi:GcrA cell cycle regulator